ncbi:hypothetical protein [Streptomyces sp. NPDC086182]|jgi:hypothetical protein|uniref:hypothetical protein n=1 Tax=Streptomyces sp. NPDC086182 TaxID=3155058 RepID=UPI00344575B9
MYRIKRRRRSPFLAVLAAALVMSVSGCADEGDVPVPTKGQVVGSWSNPGGDWINFKKEGTGLISAGAQLQLSSLIEESETRKVCPFSWKVDTVPAGGDVWVSVTFREGQCGFSGTGRFGLYAYSGKSGEMNLSPAVEFPESGEVYSRSNGT